MQMDPEHERELILNSILSKQDHLFRWGFDERQATERPQYVYYSPNFKSTLWTLVTLADICAPVDLPQVKQPITLITERFFDLEHGVFRLPGMSHFPIPCLNGNMIYIHSYFSTTNHEALGRTIAFFAEYQRFDNGDFSTPKSYPYCSNTSCYGRHTCYWGVTKLLKGISFIEKTERTAEAQRLLENCIDFVLHHEVCFSCHNKDKLLHKDIGILTFPNFYKSDYLEILWILAREGVRDKRMSRALTLLKSKQQSSNWILEKPMNVISPIGRKNCANAFITDRAAEVVAVYG